MAIQSTHELVDALLSSKQSILTFVDGLTPEQINAESTETAWNVRDHIAHLAAYTHSVVVLFEHRPRWEAVHMNKDDWQQWTLDDINTFIYQQHKNDEWKDARSDFIRAHDHLVDRVRVSSWETLQKPITDFHPDGSWLNDTRPIATVIQSNTTEHYADHLLWMHEAIQSDEQAS